MCAFNLNIIYQQVIKQLPFKFYLKLKTELQIEFCTFRQYPFFPLVKWWKAVQPDLSYIPYWVGWISLSKCQKSRWIRLSDTQKVSGFETSGFKTFSTGLDPFINIFHWCKQSLNGSNTHPSILPSIHPPTRLF